MSKHILITGGLGFIGHNLAKYYIEQGHMVTIVDNIANGAGDNAELIKYRVESLRNDNQLCNFFHNDISDYVTIMDRIKTLPTKPRSIIHLASHANQRAVSMDSRNAVSNMHTSTLVVSEIAKALNIKLIFISSSMAYGNFTNMPQSEKSELAPINLYGLLKKQGEELVRLMWGNHVIIRPSAVYGPGDNAGRVLGIWVEACIRNKPISITNGATLLDFTYVDDLVQGIVKAEKYGSAGNVYNITRGQARSLNEAAMILNELLNGNQQIRRFNDILDNSQEPIRGALDISTAENHLGYKPKYDLESGLRLYVNWAKRYYNV